MISVSKTSDGVSTSSHLGTIVSDGDAPNFGALESKLQSEYDCRASLEWNPDTSCVDIEITTPLGTEGKSQYLADIVATAQRLIRAAVDESPFLEFGELPVVEVPGIGTFRYSPEEEIWEATVAVPVAKRFRLPWSKLPKCKILIAPMAGQPDEQLVEHVRSYVERLEEIDAASREAIAEELLETFNDVWREAGPPYTRERFIGKLQLTNLTWLFREDRPYAWYGTGKSDLFMGHEIEVYYNRDFSVYSVGLYG
ncbi:DUF2262 domain-containing protein [Aeoliella sp.]|uniref:DUF2262 domain-containing protein n=1 Tax=Aeoliella sp. TaxID=2795800 RepID=UPI003CCC11F4